MSAAAFFAPGALARGLRRAVGGLCGLRRLRRLRRGLLRHESGFRQAGDAGSGSLRPRARARGRCSRPRAPWRAVRVCGGGLRRRSARELDGERARARRVRRATRCARCSDASTCYGTTTAPVEKSWFPFSGDASGKRERRFNHGINLPCTSCETKKSYVGAFCNARCTPPCFSLACTPTPKGLDLLFRQVPRARRGCGRDCDGAFVAGRAGIAFRGRGLGGIRRRAVHARLLQRRGGPRRGVLRGDRGRRAAGAAVEARPRAGRGAAGVNTFVKLEGPDDVAVVVPHTLHFGDVEHLDYTATVHEALAVQTAGSPMTPRPAGRSSASGLGVGIGRLRRFHLERACARHAVPRKAIPSWLVWLAHHADRPRSRASCPSCW